MILHSEHRKCSLSSSQKAFTPLTEKKSVNRRVFLAGLAGGTTVFTGCITVGKDTHRSESGTPKLGDVRLANEHNSSQVVHIRVTQNNSTIFQESHQVAGNAGEGPPGAGTLAKVDTPNATGEFLIEARLNNQSNWQTINSTSRGLANGACFAVVANIKPSGRLDYRPAGKGCEIDSYDEK